ncbi:GM18800 [Drosophila sechellia]|uniref:GM18800 n=1 Tax=Drosophila sechellia TaxID=7238 RepID=B4ILM1_DROSE|nr:GM18800 [Drosophila sechellia]
MDYVCTDRAEATRHNRKPQHAKCGALGKSQDRIARIAARYLWPGMHRDIRKYVRSCDSCMKYNPSQLQAAGKMSKQENVPVEKRKFDAVGSGGQILKKYRDRSYEEGDH